jgi:hypothetical protein
MSDPRKLIERARNWANTLGYDEGLVQELAAEFAAVREEGYLAGLEKALGISTEFGGTGARPQGDPRRDRAREGGAMSKLTESHEERARLWSLGYGVGAGKEQLEALAAEFAAVALEAMPDISIIKEAEARGYLAGLEEGYRQTEGSCNCGRNICAEIERVKAGASYGAAG